MTTLLNMERKMANSKDIYTDISDVRTRDLFRLGVLTNTKNTPSFKEHSLEREKKDIIPKINN